MGKGRLDALKEGFLGNIHHPPLGCEMDRVKVGEVFKYYSKPEVAAIRLTDGSLRVGDRIQIQGATTDFSQMVESMEIEREKVDDAQIGQEVGVRTGERVRPGDRVYKLVE